MNFDRMNDFYHFLIESLKANNNQPEPEMRKQTSTNWLNEERLKSSCGMVYTLSLIGGRWKPGILWMLICHGRLRFSELRDLLPGISERMLAKQLRELEADLLVNRIVYPEVPPRVEYELTELGASMRPMLEQMSEWGEVHREFRQDIVTK